MRGCSGMRRRGAARLPGQKTACPTSGREDGFCPPMETRVRRAAEFKRNTRPSPVFCRGCGCVFLGRRGFVPVCFAIGKAVGDGLGLFGKNRRRARPNNFENRKFSRRS